MLRKRSYSYVFALVWSNDDINEDREPDIKVNTTTPKISSKIQNIRSYVVDADMSPYPTVVIVVTVKYEASQYYSKGSKS